MSDVNILYAASDGPVESAPLASLLSTDATAALRSWLQAQRRARALSDAPAAIERRGADVRRAMRTLTDEARRRGVRVEQVIVLLKQLWGALPPDTAGDRRSTTGPGRRELLDEIVSVCIEEFYAPDRAGSGATVKGSSTNGASAGA